MLLRIGENEYLSDRWVNRVIFYGDSASIDYSMEENSPCQNWPSNYGFPRWVREKAFITLKEQLGYKEEAG